MKISPNFAPYMKGTEISELLSDYVEKFSEYEGYRNFRTVFNYEGKFLYSENFSQN